MHHIILLENVIQEYAWGSKTFIPELMGRPSPSKNPQAELWMGAHPKGPSRAMIRGKSVSLSEIIKKDPDGTLGSPVARRFSNQLPFLFKVLAASRPLSIQAHPDKEQAGEGFAREDREGIARNDPVRNYRDQNHKPELICALKPLWALKGFRPIHDMVRISDHIGTPARELEIDLLRKQPDKEGLKRFFTSLIAIKPDRKAPLLDEIVRRAKECRGEDPAFEWIERLYDDYPGDIGVLAPILLNLVYLKPGEAMHIPSGELHAYLGGAGLEIMANSDNVIRGGLTTKHIDLKELLRILTFTPGEPVILKPGKGRTGERHYPKTAEEFVMSRICFERMGEIYTSSRKRGAEILICVDGEATVAEKGNDERLILKRGESIFIPAKVTQYAIQGKFTIYKASVPIGL